MLLHFIMYILFYVTLINSVGISVSYLHHVKLHNATLYFAFESGYLDTNHSKVQCENIPCGIFFAGQHCLKCLLLEAFPNLHLITKHSIPVINVMFSPPEEVNARTTYRLQQFSYQLRVNKVTFGSKENFSLNVWSIGMNEVHGEMVLNIVLEYDSQFG